MKNIAEQNNLEQFKTAMSKFDILNSNDFEIIYPYLKLITLSKKEHFIDFNQKVTHIGFVVKGIFRTYYINTKGNEITTCFCYENGFINSMALSMAQINTPCAIQAIEPSKVFILSLDDLNKLFRNLKTG